MDEKLRIRLDVEGSQDVKKAEAEIAKIVLAVKALEQEFKRGKISGDQFVAFAKSADKAVQDFGITTKKSVNALSTIYHAQNRGAIGFKSLATEVVKANQQLGGAATQLKSTSNAALNLNRILQDSPFGIMGISNNIDPFLQSLRAVKAEMAATGRQGSALLVTLKSMFTGSGLAMLAGGLIPVALIMLPKLIAMFGQAKDDARDLDAALKSMVGMDNPNDPWGTPQARQEQLEASKANVKAMKSGLGQRAYRFGGLGTVAAGMFQRETARDEQRKRELAVEEAIVRVLEQQVKLDDARLAIRLRLGVVVGEEAKTELAKTGGGGQSALGAMFPGAQFGAISKWGASTGITAQGPNITPPRMAQNLPQNWSQAKDVSVKMDQSILSMGNTLANSLASGFQRGFQAGENLLDSFTRAVLAALASIAAQQAAAAAVAGVLSLIPGVGAFGQIFGALGGISLGGGGSPGMTETIDSTNSVRMGGLSGEIRGLRADMRRGVFKIQGGDLAMTVSRAEQVRSGMLIGG